MNKLGFYEGLLNLPDLKITSMNKSATVSLRHLQSVLL
jgi:hypothetical protein